MSKFQQKAEAQTRQIIGQMLGDELLVEEGKKQQREATEPGRGHDDQGARDQRSAMTKASSATSVDRSSRATRSAPSASAGWTAAATRRVRGRVRSFWAVRRAHQIQK